ncbi:CopG family transcriptional regulator [Burkholderiaceae bacterium UC74_6]
MSTTTIRVEDELKQRVNQAAERAGKTPHAFIVEAIAAKVAEDEAAAELERIADERWSRLQESGKTVAWSDARQWIEAKSRGEKTRKPVARKLAR